MTKLYENIKILCEEKNISILGLEEAAGLKKNTICHWKNAMPRCDKIIILANYFDVSIDFLVGNSSNRYSHKSVISPASLILLQASEETKISEETAKILANSIRGLTTLL